MSVIDDAQILWDYHQLHHEPRKTDIGIGLGSHDIGVDEHAAELWHEGRFPLIVFTGANAPTTVDVFPRDEAVHYSERAQELGVPADVILTETRATNTGENSTFTLRAAGRVRDPPGVGNNHQPAVPTAPRRTRPYARIGQRLP